MTEPEISVALVTRNGPERLAGCLASLRAQSIQPSEVVVSDDSDPEWTARTREVAADYNCRYLSGPRRGLYANRNHVAHACVGTHIRTMDDDHRFPPGHFEKCLSAILYDSQAIWTTGEIGYIDDVQTDTVNTAQQLHQSGVGCQPRDLQRNWTIADGSTIYPASVFQAGHRMVESFGYGSSYLEFGAYLFRSGYYSRCLPDVLVEHYASHKMLERFVRYDVDVTSSVLFASLAYNLYFRPHPARAAYYLLRAIARSRGDRELLVRLPRILKSVRKRWKSPPEGVGVAIGEREFLVR